MRILQRRRTAALSLADVLIVLATVLLAAYVGLVAMPLRHRYTGGCRVSCISNLKQIGLAFRLYANDNGDKFPWQISTNKGGSFEYATSPEVFVHYLVASNELNTPKILGCRADQARTRISDWSQLGNTNLSYFVCLNANQDEPNQLLSGDRNLLGGTLSNKFLRTFTATSKVAWSTAIHTNNGNIGLCDGSAQQLNSPRAESLVHSNATPRLALAIP